MGSFLCDLCGLVVGAEEEERTVLQMEPSLASHNKYNLAIYENTKRIYENAKKI